MNSSYMQFLNIGTVYCKITQKCLQIFTKIFGKTPAVSAILGCHTNKTLCEIQEGLMSCSPSIYSGLLFCIQPHSSFSKSKFYFLTSHKAAGCHVRPHSSPMLCSFFFLFLQYNTTVIISPLVHACVSSEICVAITYTM